jgi:hypothetical protein
VATRAKRDLVKRLLDDRVDPAEHRKAKNLRLKADIAENKRRIAEEQAAEAARLVELARLNDRLTVRGLL